jgi:hypothetical protein
MNYKQAVEVAESAKKSGRIDNNAVIVQVIPRKNLIEVRTKAKNQRNENQFYGWLLTKDGINLEAPGKPNMFLKEGQFGPYKNNEITFAGNDKGSTMDLVISEFGEGHKFVFKTLEQASSLEKWRTTEHYVVDLRS